MIDVKEAAAKAIQFAQDVYSGKELHDLRLEEVELVEGSWHITLSYCSAPLTTLEATTRAAGISTPHREYKIFKVDEDDGTVYSMKIRQLA